MRRPAAIRTVGLVAAGAITGAALTGWLMSMPPDRAGPASVIDELTARFRAPQEAPVVGLGERLALARDVAVVDDPAALVAAMVALAAAEPSAEHDLGIEIRLMRLADLDPARAAALALELRLPQPFVVMTFEYWALDEPAAALDALGSVAPATARRAVALALTDVLGTDRRAFERVADALPEHAAQALRVDWLARRAEREPIAAYREAVALRDESLRRRALERVAAVWAVSDPLGALAQARTLPADIARVFAGAAAYEWARLDPAAFLDYVASGTLDPGLLTGGFQLATAAAPVTAVVIAERLRGEEWQQFRRSAFGALGEVDPERALARADSTLRGREHEMITSMVAQRFAEDDAEGALAWLRRSSPLPSQVVSAVMFGIGSSNPDLAVDLILDPPAGLDPNLAPVIAGSAILRDPESAGRIADRLLASGGTGDAALSNLLGSWIGSDRGRALDWVLANGSRLGRDAIGNAAARLARDDPAAAAGVVDRLPADLREIWIVQVAGPYAGYDLAGAVDWIARFQGSDAYEPALRQVINHAAQQDADRAAELLVQSSPAVQVGAAGQVAMQLARRDPQGALDWTERLGREARDEAVATVMAVWADTDADASLRHARGLEPGPARDLALVNMVSGLWRSDPDAARELSDLAAAESTRQRIEEQIAFLESR